MTRPIRTWLYCPGTRADLIEKAIAGDADAVVIDLEDAVPAAAKSMARDNAVGALSGTRHKPVWIRMNSLDSPWGPDDARALATARPDGVRVPKCGDVDEVRRIAETLDTPLGLLLESAQGVERAYDLAAADHRVVSISLGEADLMADLRVRRHEALEWARTRVVVAARAAGLPSPSQSVHTVIADDEGLRATTRAGRDLGFFGRSVVHPRQIPIVNEVYTPDPDEVARARHVLRLMADATAQGRAVAVDESGHFVDPAVAEQSAWVAELSDAIEAHRHHTTTTKRRTHD